MTRRVVGLLSLLSNFLRSSDENKLTLSVFVRMSHKCRKQKRIMQLSASWGLLQINLIFVNRYCIKVIKIMGIVISIIGVLIAGWAIKLQFFSKPQEELDLLKLQFRTTQKLSLQVQKELEDLIIQYNGWYREMFPNITYGAYLEEMKSSYKKNLSDELLNNIVSLNPTKSTIMSMIKSLETQFEALNQVQSQLNILRRQLSE